MTLHRLSQQGGEPEQFAFRGGDVDDIAAVYAGHDVVFNALGTTRGKAGGATPFYLVDHDYVRTSAALAKHAGVPHFSLVTAQGARRGMKWYARWLHPTWYAKTKGDAELSALAQGFARVTVWRPGLLNRANADLGGKHDRAGEKWANRLLGGLKVGTLARAMLGDALRRGGSAGGAVVDGNGAVTAAAAAPVEGGAKL